MAKNKISKLTINSNESLPITLDDTSGELNIDYDGLKVGGINSTSANDYPFIRDLREANLKTGLYRADSTTLCLPHDALEEGTCYIVFVIADNVPHVYYEKLSRTTQQLMILIEDVYDGYFERSPRMWLGINYSEYNDGGSGGWRWASLDSRGGCGRDIMCNFDENKIDDFKYNDKPTGFYWAEADTRNSPNYKTRFIVEKINHGESPNKYFNAKYTHVATYRATEAPQQNFEELPTAAPVVWNGYVYIEKGGEKKHIKWFKA